MMNGEVMYSDGTSYSDKWSGNVTCVVCVCVAGKSEGAIHWADSPRGRHQSHWSSERDGPGGPGDLSSVPC